MELIERQEGVDAVIVRSDGHVLYSSGLAPPAKGGPQFP
jgi:hypothetical protein